MTITLSHRDLVPKFLAFWQVAASVTEEEERWRLWQEHYGFAAVPPTPTGLDLARKLLQEAWSLYPAVIERLPGAVEQLRAEADQVSDRVSTLLELDRPVETTLVSFVGGFEGNPFAAGTNVCIPVEVEIPAFILAHELIHRVHAVLAGAGGGWRRSVAMLLLEEGLATRGSRALYPGVSDADHLSYTNPSWVQACMARDTQILSGIIPDLARDDDESLLRCTMQVGPAGLIREGYWAGWRAVGHLLEEGWSFSRLARVSEAEAAPLVEGALRRLLQS